MKKQFTILSILSILVFAVFSCFMLTGQANAETEVSGIINSNTTWTLNNSPYIVIDTVQIPAGITLTIEQGVIIKINSEKKIRIAGTLNVNGSENLPIKFTSNNSNKWWGIEFINSNSNISNSIIENATRAIDLQGVSIIPFTGNLFRYNDWVITDTGGYQSMQFLDNTFLNNNEVFYGIRISGDNNRFENNIFVDNNSVFNHGYYFGCAVVINNNFLDNNFIIKAPGNGYGYGNIDISNNWWGTVNKSVIDSHIEDGSDNVSLQILNYNPIKSFEIDNIGSLITISPTFITCTSWTYSNWSECINGQQTRTIASSSPKNCIDGNPVLSQSCQVEINNEDNAEAITQHESETNESNPNNPIPEGAVIKTEHNPDVYIVKYKNGKQFKRLVLNPQVFESYGHLRWEDILIVSQGEMDSFVVSDLVRVDGQTDIYQLVPNGDVGTKVLLESTAGYDLDLVYTINGVDSENYVICSYDFYNCSDFENQADAQRIFDVCGGINNDIHKLDGDNNGIPCESSSWSY